jgi:hypothetical protein
MTNRINLLIKSNYGNYVIQKALKVANLNAKFSLINNILQNLDKLGDKKLMIKWKHIVDSTIEECMKHNMLCNMVNMYESIHSGENLLGK